MRLRMNNGLEFCFEEFDEFYKEEGIARQHIIQRTPQQNGVARPYQKGTDACFQTQD